MLSTLISLISWAFVLFMGVVTLLLALNKTSGLSLIQHRTDMLPQALLVRYGGLTVLALIASWLSAPRMLFGILLAFAVISAGDALIYRRAGHPFWLHLIVAAVAALGALLAVIAIP